MCDYYVSTHRTVDLWSGVCLSGVQGKWELLLLPGRPEVAQIQPEILPLWDFRGGWCQNAGVVTRNLIKQSSSSWVSRACSSHTVTLSSDGRLNWTTGCSTAPGMAFPERGSQNGSQPKRDASASRFQSTQIWGFAFIYST